MAHLPNLEVRGLLSDRGLPLSCRRWLENEGLQPLRDSR